MQVVFYNILQWWLFSFFCISAYKKKNVKQIDQWKIQNCNMHSVEA